MNRWLRALAGGLAGSVVIGVAGCSAVSGAVKAASDGAPTDAQITAAMKGATSVHVTGQVTTSKQTVKMDISVLRNGGLSGNVTAPGTPQVSVIAMNGKVWVQLTRAFLAGVGAPASACATECGKYLQLTGAEASQMTSDLTMADITKPVNEGLPGLIYAGKTTVNGQAAFKFTGKDVGTLDVAAHGKPYPLLISGGKDTAGTLIFSQWNAVTPPAAPAASLITHP